ncbi:MAG: Histone acetyltransferase type B subunit 2 [Marteilia pararefringens]
MANDMKETLNIFMQELSFINGNVLENPSRIIEKDMDDILKDFVQKNMKNSQIIENVSNLKEICDKQQSKIKSLEEKLKKEKLICQRTKEELLHYKSANYSCTKEIAKNENDLRNIEEKLKLSNKVIERLKNTNIVKSKKTNLNFPVGVQCDSNHNEETSSSVDIGYRNFINSINNRKDTTKSKRSKKLSKMVELRKFETENDNFVDIFILPDSPTKIFKISDSKIWLVDIAGGKQGSNNGVRIFNHALGISSVVSFKGDSTICGMTDGSLELVKISDEFDINSISLGKIMSSPINCINMNPQKSTCGVSSSKRQTNIYIFDVEKASGSIFKTIRVLRRHKKAINKCKFDTFDHNLVTSVSDDSSCKLWDTRTGFCEIDIRDESKPTPYTAFSAYEYQKLALGNKCGDLTIYDYRMKCFNRAKSVKIGNTGNSSYLLEIESIGDETLNREQELLGLTDCGNLFTYDTSTRFSTLDNFCQNSSDKNTFYSNFLVLNKQNENLMIAAIDRNYLRLFG